MSSKRTNGSGRFTFVEAINSQTDFYIDLAASMIASDPPRLSRNRDKIADITTIRRRTQRESLSFLTKTLPKLGKALDKALEEGHFSVPSGFKRSAQSENIPALLQVYFMSIFEPDGRLRENPNVGAIKHLRQVLFAFYKLELPYSPNQEEKVLSGFIQTEQELKAFATPVTDHIDLASWIVEEVFRDFDPYCIVPRHGPGAVATGEKLDEKYVFGRYYTHLHQFYPFSCYMRTSTSHFSDQLAEMIELPRYKSGTAKVVLVPKDSRGPRLISCEPLEYQWIQQGLGRALSAHIESHPLTSGRVNFSSQEYNRSLALQSSIDRSYATLDLKDASDRNSLELVRSLFAGCNKLLRALESCRTEATILPDGRRVPLVKFAPMGSACCFPVEAICFWALAVAARCVEERLTFEEAASQVYVYGDDIIVPTHAADSCIRILEECYLKVNLDKSCIKGFFRESCGMDAFKGVEITPTRVKSLWSNTPSDGHAYASYVSYLNSFRVKGYHETFEFLRNAITRTYGSIPYGTSDSSFPCIHVADAGTAEVSNLIAGFKHRYNADLQREEFRLKYLSPRRKPTELDSWERLLRNVVSGEQKDPSTVVLPYSTQIKYGWRRVD